MKNLTIILSVICISAFLSSCSTTTPLTATDNEIGEKEGSSSTTCLFSTWAYAVQQTGRVTRTEPQTLNAASGTPTARGACFGLKEYGIYEAAQNGGISEVATVDLKVTNYILWKDYELIVTGK